MRKILVAAIAVPLILAGSASPAGAASPSSTPTVPTATAGFYHNLFGVSRFTQRGSTVRVRGAYAFLKPSSAYFTVVYGNSICDPAQAFPIGPFYTNTQGFGTINQSATTTIPNLVAGTMSISVRRGDDSTDIDGDGLFGPTDVVAVPGNPSIGLIECNGAPTVTP